MPKIHTIDELRKSETKMDNEPRDNRRESASTKRIVSDGILQKTGNSEKGDSNGKKLSSSKRTDDRDAELGLDDGRRARRSDDQRNERTSPRYGKSNQKKDFESGSSKARYREEGGLDERQRLIKEMEADIERESQRKAREMARKVAKDGVAAMVKNQCASHPYEIPAWNSENTTKWNPYMKEAVQSEIANQKLALRKRMNEILKDNDVFKIQAENPLESPECARIRKLLDEGGENDDEWHAIESKYAQKNKPDNVALEDWIGERDAAYASHSKKLLDDCKAEIAQLYVGEEWGDKIPEDYVDHGMPVNNYITILYGTGKSDEPLTASGFTYREGENPTEYAMRKLSSLSMMTGANMSTEHMLKMFAEMPREDFSKFIRAVTSARLGTVVDAVVVSKDDQDLAIYTPHDVEYSDVD